VLFNKETELEPFRIQPSSYTHKVQHIDELQKREICFESLTNKVQILKYSVCSLRRWQKSMHNAWGYGETKMQQVNNF